MIQDSNLRVGVFVCDCGHNIASVVDTTAGVKSSTRLVIDAPEDTAEHEQRGLGVFSTLEERRRVFGLPA